MVLGPQEVLGILVSLQVQALLLSQQLLEDQVVLVALAGCDLNNNRSGFDSTVLKTLLLLSLFSNHRGSKCPFSAVFSEQHSSEGPAPYTLQPGSAMRLM